MDLAAFDGVALSLIGATRETKWGNDRVYTVGGKMFAIVGLDADAPGPPRYSFKASATAFRMLVDQGVARPAPYLARATWVQLLGPDLLSDGDLRSYVAEAHRLVAARLTRKIRGALGFA